MRATGVAEDARWLGVALATQVQPIPGIGTFYLDPASLVITPTTPFAATPRLPSVNYQFAVPASALGLDVYLQEIHADVLAQQPRLTNVVHLDL